MLKKYKIFVARELVKIAKVLIAYKYGTVQVLLLKRAGIETTPSGIASLLKTADDDTKKKIENSTKAKAKLEASINKWAVFAGNKDNEFVEYAWFLLGLGEPLLVADGNGGGKVDETSAEKLHDSWTLYKHFLTTEQVGADASELSRKIKAKSIGFDGFVNEVAKEKAKYKSLTVNSHLETDEKEAWEELENGKKWSVGGFDVYEVNDFSTLNSVAGDNSSNKTEWCVALEKNFFDDYKPPYYMFAKNHVPETLVHLDSRQVKNTSDHTEDRSNNIAAVLEFLEKEFSYRECDLMTIFKDETKEYVEDFIDRNDYDDDFIDLCKGEGRTLLLSNEEVTRIKMFSLNDDTLKKYLNERNGVLSKEEKEGLVKNICISPETLDSLANDEDEEVRAGVALNPNIKYDTMVRLSTDNSDLVRSCLVQNFEVDSSIVKKMLNDNSIGVLISIAKRSDTTGRMLDILSKNPNANELLLQHVANNRKCYPETLERIFNDSSVSEEVKMRVLSNPNTPREIIEKAKNNNENSDKMKCWIVRRVPGVGVDTLRRFMDNASIELKKGIMHRLSSYRFENCKDVWERLSEDTSTELRLYIAEKITTPREILKKLCNDLDKNVKSKAVETLKRVEDENIR